MPSNWGVEVWLGASPEVAQRFSGMPSSYFAEADGGCLLRTSIEDLEVMARYLAGLPFHLRIRQPIELRATLRRYALRLAREVIKEE